jgi:stage V sporulation protein B
MKFFKALKATFIATIFVIALGIVTGSFTTHILSQTDRGVLAKSAAVIALFLIMIDLGIGAANTYFIAKNKRDIGKILGCNVLIVLFECVLITLLFLFGRNSDFIAFTFIFKRLSGLVLVLTLFTVPISSIKSALTNVLLGMEQYANYNKLNVLFQMFNFITIFIFLIRYNSVSSVLIANMTAMFAIILCQIFLLLKQRIKISFSLNTLRNMLYYGIRAQFSNFVQYFTYSLDVLIIGYFLGDIPNALYGGVAVPLATMMWQIPGVIATIIYPSVSNSDDKEYIKDITNKTTRISIVAIVLCCIILALVSRPLVLAYAGSSYVKSGGANGAVLPLLLLIPGIAFFSISKILANSLAGMGRIDINLKISAIVCILTVVLDFTFIPIYGIIGASVVTSVTYICHAVLTLFFYKRLTDSRVRDIILINKGDRKVIKEKLLGRFKKIGA